MNIGGVVELIIPISGGVFIILATTGKIKLSPKNAEYFSKHKPLFLPLGILLVVISVAQGILRITSS